MPRWLDAGRLCGVELDRRWALALHRGAARPLLLRALIACSRLADGPLWVLLPGVLLLIGGPRGTRCAWLLLAVGAVNLVIYWCLKHGTRRLRPFHQCTGIRACAVPPDHFSFPSGHTLHATAFAVLLSACYPTLAPLLGTFAVLVGASRVVLGLHYPSDVLVGALIGAATAALALLL